MKKIKICLLLFVGMFISCDDALDIKQPGQVDPTETYATMAGFRKNLVGVYGTLSYESTISFSSIFTDEVGIGFANGGQGLNDGTYSYLLNAGSDAPSSIWYAYYNSIANCNRLIKGSELVPHTEEETAEFNHIIAQAKAIRAFSYFQLLSYFSTDLTNDDALGVMSFDYVADKNTPSIPRSKNGDVFAFINADLDFVDDNLLDVLTFDEDANPVYYITPNFVTALRARMALYRGDIVNAQSYAQDLINLVPLTPKSTYRQIWSDQINGECIFKMSRSINDATIGSIWASVNATVTGSPFFEMGRSLYNTFSGSYETDIRIMTSQGGVAGTGQVLLHPSALVDSDYLNSPDYRNSDILPIAKYTRSESTNLLGDVKVFRVSEMYFIKAEVQIADGNLSGAAATIRQVRNARFGSTQPLPTFLNEKEAYAGILLERRKELAYEGHRYLDLKRLAVKADVTIDRDSKDCSFNNSCNFSNTDYRLVSLPIPTSELSANPFIRGQQNPGY